VQLVCGYWSYFQKIDQHLADGKQQEGNIDNSSHALQPHILSAEMDPLKANGNNRKTKTDL
jgi:hypothetical protein